jgi:O-antigen/teichoic acid export membrane protein
VTDLRSDALIPGSLYGRITRNTALLFAGMTAASVFTMLTVAVNARALTAREFGVLVLLQSASQMVAIATSFYTQQPIIKLGALARAEGDKDRLGKIISMGLLTDLFSSLTAFAIALAAIELFSGAVGLADQDLAAARIMAATLIFNGYPTSNGIFRLFHKFGVLSLIQTLCAAGLLIASVILFFLEAPFEDFVLAWAGYIILNYQLQLWISLYLVRRASIPLPLKGWMFSGGDGRAFIQYCWSTWATSSVDTLRSNGDSLLVGAVVSVEAAGVYNVARQLAGVLRKFGTVYTSTVFPEVSMLSAQGNVEAARHLKTRMMLASSLVGAAAVAGVVVLGHLLIHFLFGARFAEGYVPLILLTAAAAAQFVSHTPSMYVQVYVGPKRLLLVYLAAVGIFILAAVPLTFALSITGTAMAQLVFALALVLLCQFSLHRTPLSGGIDKTSPHSRQSFTRTRRK